MKKRVILILAAALCITAGLAVFISKNHVKDTDVYGNNNIDINISVADNGQNDSQNYWNPDNHAVAKGDGGYYYIMKTDNIYRIMFFDEASKEFIPLCAKPECMHEDNTCNAFIANKWNRGQQSDKFLSETLYYYENYLYMIKCDTGMGKLVRISLDGSERKDIDELFPNSWVYSISLVFHDDYVYAYDDTGHAGQTTEAEEVIKKMSLKDGSSENVFSYKGVGASIDRGRSYGEKLYFVTREYSLNKDTAQQKIEYKGLYEYDYNSGDEKKVIEGDICDYSIDTVNQCIYYFVDGKGLYKYSQTDGKNELIYAAHNELITCKMSYDGKYIYMYNTGMGSLTDGKSRVKPKCFVLDSTGNVINEILCPGMVYFGDENYLFADEGHGIVYIDKKNIKEAVEWTELK